MTKLMMLPLLFFMFVLADASTLRKRAALTTLDPFSLKTLTRIVRENLLDKVALELNDTVKAEEGLRAESKLCEAMVNNTIDACTAQAQAQCGASPPSGGNFLQLLNPLNHISGPLNQIGSTLKDVKDLVGRGGLKFFNSVGGLAEEIGKRFPEAVQDIFHGALNGLQDGLNTVGKEFAKLGGHIFRGVTGVGSRIGDLATDIGSRIGDVAKNIGSGIGDVVGKVGKGITDTVGKIGRGFGSIGRKIGGIFGKRSVDAATKRCMQQIPACRPLLREETAMLRQICGDALFDKQLALEARAAKMMGVYNATIDKAVPLIHKIEFEFVFNPAMTFSPVFVTATINKAPVRYQSAVPYRMSNIPLTAQELAVEYWNKS